LRKCKNSRLSTDINSSNKLSCKVDIENFPNQNKKEIILGFVDVEGERASSASFLLKFFTFRFLNIISIIIICIIVILFFIVINSCFSNHSKVAITLSNFIALQKLSYINDSSARFRRERRKNWWHEWISSRSTMSLYTHINKRSNYYYKNLKPTYTSKSI